MKRKGCVHRPETFQVAIRRFKTTGRWLVEFKCGHLAVWLDEEVKEMGVVSIA